MPRKKSATLVFDSQAALENQAELERTVRELQQCLTRFETLHKSFRRRFLKLFVPENHCAAETSDALDPQVEAALSNIFFFHQANLAGQSLTHLRYAVDLADLACGLTHYRGGNSG